VQHRPALKTLLLASGVLGVLSCGTNASATPVAPDSMFDFTFSIGPDTGFGSLDTVDIGGGSFNAVGGSLTVTGGFDIGTYSLAPGGPGVTISPFGAFAFDNILFSASNPFLDVWGLLFTGGGLEINIWGNAPDNYSFYSYNGSSYNVAYDGGSTFRASPVSEPATLSLLSTGLLGFGLLLRRRKG
jgi:hypothetical protein